MGQSRHSFFLSSACHVAPPSGNWYCRDGTSTVLVRDEEEALKMSFNGCMLEEFLLSTSKEMLDVADHLTWCTTCQERFKALLSRHPGGGNELILKDEGSEALGLLVELLEYPSDQRVSALHNSPRFHTGSLLELFVERSLEATPRDPNHGEELGFLALRLSESLASSYGAGRIEDLRARAWAHIGNARRVKSDLRRAEKAFAAAYRHLQDGTKGCLERAILFDLEASLRRDQRRFDQACKLLRRSIAIFLENGQRHRAGQSLVKLSTVYHDEGLSERGIPMLYEALDLIDSEQESRLLLCVKHNLADYLSSVGSFREAQEIQHEARFLYRSFPDAWTQNRRKWVEGKIVRGLGQADEAESLFLEARDGFVAEGISYDTALVSLELATLYAEQGRTVGLKRLAGEMVPIFSSLKIHRETLAALAYLI